MDMDNSVMIATVWTTVRGWVKVEAGIEEINGDGKKENEMKTPKIKYYFFKMKQCLIFEACTLIRNMGNKYK